MSGEAAAVDTQTLPTEFEMTLFESPPAGATSAIRTSDGLFDVAIGIPVLFADLDGDGMLAASSEPVLGLSRGELVLYAGPAARKATTEVALASDALPTAAGRSARRSVTVTCGSWPARASTTGSKAPTCLLPF